MAEYTLEQKASLFALIDLRIEAEKKAEAKARMKKPSKRRR